MSAAAAKKHVFKFLTPFVIFLISSFVTLSCNQNIIYGGSGLVSSVGGATFIQGATQFWVTSGTPTFSGITTASAPVTGTVGSQAVSVTADASGNWSWTPPAALSGDNPVTITSGATTVNFTLTIGELPANIASASAGSLAPAGTTNPTFWILSIGTILVLSGMFGFKKSFK